MSDIFYTVTFTGSSTSLQFTMTTFNSTNYCTLRVLGSELSPSDTYTVSVVASNIVGSGTAAVFPNTGWLFTNYVQETPLHYMYQTSIISYKHKNFQLMLYPIENRPECPPKKFYLIIDQHQSILLTFDYYCKNSQLLIYLLTSVR